LSRRALSNERLLFAQSDLREAGYNLAIMDEIEPVNRIRPASVVVQKVDSGLFEG